MSTTAPSETPSIQPRRPNVISVRALRSSIGRVVMAEVNKYDVFFSNNGLVSQGRRGWNVVFLEILNEVITAIRDNKSKREIPDDELVAMVRKAYQTVTRNGGKVYAKLLDHELPAWGETSEEKSLDLIARCVDEIWKKKKEPSGAHRLTENSPADTRSMTAPNEESSSMNSVATESDNIRKRDDGLGRGVKRQKTASFEDAKQPASLTGSAPGFASTAASEVRTVETVGSAPLGDTRVGANTEDLEAEYFEGHPFFTIDLTDDLFDPVVDPIKSTMDTFPDAADVTSACLGALKQFSRN